MSGQLGSDKDTVIQFKKEMTANKYPGLKESKMLSRILEIAWNSLEFKMTEAEFQIDQIYRELINSRKQQLSALTPDPELILTESDKTKLMIKAAAIFIANQIE